MSWRRAGDEFVSWGVKGGCKPQATSPKSKRAPPNFIYLFIFYNILFYYLSLPQQNQIKQANEFHFCFELLNEMKEFNESGMSGALVLLIAGGYERRAPSTAPKLHFTNSFFICCVALCLLSVWFVCFQQLKKAGMHETSSFSLIN